MPRAAPKKKPATPKARRKAVATLAPKTAKPDPDDDRIHHTLSLPTRSAGVRVTEDTALTLGAVFACVRVITEDLAGLPWHVHEKRAKGGSDERPEDPADWLLHTQASPETPAFQWRETIIAHALTWGNGYAEIERDGAGRPAWLWLLTPDRVEPERFNGRIVYDVMNPREANTTLEAEDVFHLRGLGFDGLKGYSVIQLAARSIGAGIALDQSTADLFGNDSTPGGLLKHPGRLSDQARGNLQQSWERRHQGPTNRRRVAILEEGMSWEQTGLPPEDTKLIEQRQFTPSDICRWFRVKPHKIADLSRSTFSNIEHQGIEHVTDTLLPWARRLETEANIKLFGRTNRGKRFTKLNLNALLRGDTAAQTAHIKEMLSVGVYDINDALGYLDRNPIGPDGEKRFVPLNMQLLEQAGEEPPAPPAPPSPDDDEPPPDNAPPDDAEPTPPDDTDPLRAYLWPVFEDAARRLLHAESERAREGLKGGPARLETWLEKVRAKHSAFVRNQLRPAATALALARGRAPDTAEAGLATFAETHLETFKDRLVAAVQDPATLATWPALAPTVAASLFDQLTAPVEAAQ